MSIVQKVFIDYLNRNNDDEKARQFYNKFIIREEENLTEVLKKNKEIKRLKKKNKKLKKKLKRSVVFPKSKLSKAQKTLLRDEK